jgi:hypothetical protein
MSIFTQKEALFFIITTCTLLRAEVDSMKQLGISYLTEMFESVQLRVKNQYTSQVFDRSTLMAVYNDLQLIWTHICILRNTDDPHTNRLLMKINSLLLEQIHCTTH